MEGSYVICNRGKLICRAFAILTTDRNRHLSCVKLNNKMTTRTESVESSTMYLRFLLGFNELMKFWNF